MHVFGRKPERTFAGSVTSCKLHRKSRDSESNLCAFSYFSLFCHLSHTTKALLQKREHTGLCCISMLILSPTYNLTKDLSDSSVNVVTIVFHCNAGSHRRTPMMVWIIFTHLSFWMIEIFKPIHCSLSFNYSYNQQSLKFNTGPIKNSLSVLSLH